jgi:ribose/xylose/arabinose/galactoside ABC-type transport system permease subunit
MIAQPDARRGFDVRAAGRAFWDSPGGPIYLALVAVFLTAWLLVGRKGGQFLTLQNISDILIRSVALGLVAVGQTLVILGGSLDLSVAYLVSVSAVTASVVMQGEPSRILAGVAASVGLGAVVGLANGVAIAWLGINAFIATLGMSLILKGAIYTAVNDFSGAVPSAFQSLAYNNIGPVPIAIVLLAAVALAAWFLLNHTRFGHHLYAVGASEPTARLSGIRSQRVLITAHVLCSLTAVLTGLFIASRLRAGAPWVGTDGAYDLESIAAVVLGGTALGGGTGGVPGTLAGVFILSIIDVAFNDLEVDPFLKTVVRGLIIIAAVASYSLRARRRA